MCLCGGQGRGLARKRTGVRFEKKDWNLQTAPKPKMDQLFAGGEKGIETAVSEKDHLTTQANCFLTWTHSDLGSMTALARGDMSKPPCSGRQAETKPQKNHLN